MHFNCKLKTLLPLLPPRPPLLMEAPIQRRDVFRPGQVNRHKKTGAPHKRDARLRKGHTVFSGDQVLISPFPGTDMEHFLKGSGKMELIRIAYRSPDVPDGYIGKFKEAAGLGHPVLDQELAGRDSHAFPEYF